MPVPSKSDALLLPLAFLACAAGVAGVLVVIGRVAAGHAHAREEAAVIHLPTIEERMREPGMASRGQAVFEAQACIACHGKFLEGGVGPCLTDAVWAKGSSPAEIRKSINEGSSEKGMPAFEKTLSEDDKIALVAFLGSRAQGLRDVKYALYEGKWAKLPDFTVLKPVDTGALKADEPIALAKFERNDNYGVVFTGRLLVPETGEYAFHLASDDGSDFSLDGVPVVSNDGVHDDKGRKHGATRLAAGAHDFQLRYFQGGGGQALRLTWDGPASLGFLTEAVDAPEQIVVKDRVRIVRGNIGGQIGPRMLAIGLPGGVNAAFDTDSFALPFGWRGEFLDVGGSRQGRGQSPNQPTGGKPAAQTAKSFVHVEEAIPEFLGYHVAGRRLVIEGALKGARFEAAVEAAAKGVEVTVLFRDPVPAGALLEDASGSRPAGAGPQVLHFAF